MNSVMTRRSSDVNDSRTDTSASYEKGGQAHSGRASGSGMNGARAVAPATVRRSGEGVAGRGEKGRAERDQAAGLAESRVAGGAAGGRGDEDIRPIWQRNSLSVQLPELCAGAR